MAGKLRWVAVHMIEETLATLATPTSSARPSTASARNNDRDADLLSSVIRQNRNHACPQSAAVSHPSGGLGHSAVSSITSESAPAAGSPSPDSNTEKNLSPPNWSDLANRLGEPVWVPAEWPVDLNPPEYHLMLPPTDSDSHDLRSHYQLRSITDDHLLLVSGHRRVQGHLWKAVCFQWKVSSS